jgi:hypothetical protein
MYVSEEGKYVRRSLKTRDKEIAIKRAEEEFIRYKAKIQNGEKVFSLIASEMRDKYLEYVKNRVKVRSISEGRASNIRTYTKHWLNFVGDDTRIQAIDARKFREYLEYRQEQVNGITTTVVINEAITIKQMYKWAIDSAFLSQKHFPDFGEIKAEKHEVRRDSFSIPDYLSLTDLARLWHTKVADKSLKRDEEIYYRKSVRDFIILMARTGDGKRQEGVTAFIVEKGTPGFIIEREISMIGGRKTYELVFEDCRVPESQVLGELGRGYAPMQLRLNVRRLQMGARCVGMTRRALDMMADQARNRITFGVRLADRQAIQWWVAEAATRMHACKLMVADLAAKLDAGADVRMEASMLKVEGTEMAQDILDQAMQTFGAMGVTKELPLQLMHQQVRLMRVYEGPSEVHRSAIGRRILGSKV